VPIVKKIVNVAKKIKLAGAEPKRTQTMQKLQNLANIVIIISLENVPH